MLWHSAMLEWISFFIIKWIHVVLNKKMISHGTWRSHPDPLPVLFLPNLLFMSYRMMLLSVGSGVFAKFIWHLFLNPRFALLLKIASWISCFHMPKNVVKVNICHLNIMCKSFSLPTYSHFPTIKISIRNNYNSTGGTWQENHASTCYLKPTAQVFLVCLSVAGVLEFQDGDTSGESSARVDSCSNTWTRIRKRAPVGLLPSLGRREGTEELQVKTGSPGWPRVWGERSSPVRCAHSPPLLPSWEGVFLCRSCFCWKPSTDALDRDIKLTWDEIVFHFESRSVILIFLKELDQNLIGPENFLKKQQQQTPKKQPTKQTKKARHILYVWWE